jgi:hypothetical protein
MLKLHHALFLGTFIVTVVVLLYFFPPFEKVDRKNCQDCGEKIIIHESENPKFIEQIIPENQIDPVFAYDVNTLTNPFIPPSSRPADYLFRSVVDNPYFNFPSRGMSDSFSYLGYLVKQSTLDNTQEEYQQSNNNLVQVMGRQKYPNSNQYQYYALISKNNGSNEIKIPLNTRKNEELYDGDFVTVPELGNLRYTFRKNKSYFDYV